MSNLSCPLLSFVELSVGHSQASTQVHPVTPHTRWASVGMAFFIGDRPPYRACPSRREADDRNTYRRPESPSCRSCRPWLGMHLPPALACGDHFENDYPGDQNRSRPTNKNAKIPARNVDRRRRESASTRCRSRWRGPVYREASVRLLACDGTRRHRTDTGRLCTGDACQVDSSPLCRMPSKMN